MVHFTTMFLNQSKYTISNDKIISKNELEWKTLEVNRSGIVSSTIAAIACEN